MNFLEKFSVFHIGSISKQIFNSLFYLRLSHLREKLWRTFARNNSNACLPKSVAATPAQLASDSVSSSPPIVAKSSFVTAKVLVDDVCNKLCQNLSQNKYVVPSLSSTPNQSRNFSTFAKNESVITYQMGLFRQYSKANSPIFGKILPSSKSSDEKLAPQEASGIKQNVTSPSSKSRDQKIAKKEASGMKLNLTRPSSKNPDQKVAPKEGSDVKLNLTRPFSKSSDQKIAKKEPSGIKLNVTSPSSKNPVQKVAPKEDTDIKLNLSRPFSKSPDHKIAKKEASDIKLNLTSHDIKPSAKSASVKPKRILISSLTIKDYFNGFRTMRKQPYRCLPACPLCGQRKLSQRRDANKLMDFCKPVILKSQICDPCEQALKDKTIKIPFTKRSPCGVSQASPSTCQGCPKDLPIVGSTKNIPASEPCQSSLVIPNTLSVNELLEGPRTTTLVLKKDFSVTKGKEVSTAKQPILGGPCKPSLKSISASIPFQTVNALEPTISSTTEVFPRIRILEAANEEKRKLCRVVEGERPCPICYPRGVPLTRIRLF